MQPEDNHLSIPPEFESSPWIQQLVSILKEQVQRIQEQTQRIQEQAEEISALKKTVQEQKDEINRLKNMPKRPKFRPGGGDPKGRSGEPGAEKEKNQANPRNDLTPNKKKEEIIVKAPNIPAGSRFKGYQDYSVQELELIRDGRYRSLVFRHWLHNGFDEKNIDQSEPPILLLAGIKDGTFRFKGLNPEGKVGDWSERWEDSQLTPLSIQLELDMSEESRIDWPLLEVVMMVDGGATRGFNAGFLPSG